jgi:two-component system, NarL family, nitrate/nitrite response regulator NarL
MELTTNILTVDDHQLILDGLKLLLEQNPKFKVVAEANDGVEALAHIQNHLHDIHVVLTDISMPQMDGIQLCKELKRHHPQVKVIMLTMYSTIAIIDAAIEAEADGLLLKNAGSQELFKALHRVIHHSTYFSREVAPLISNQVKYVRETKELLDKITQREYEILKLIIEEFTSEEIASKLFISKKTVDNHRSHLLEKTGSKSTIGLVKFALQAGL